MAVSSADILSLANKLSGEATECEWRASVSRAYYSALHVALAVRSDPLAQKHLQDTSAWDAGFSTKVIAAFTGASCPLPVKSAGYVLNQLRQERVAADYDIDGSLSKDLAAASVKLSQKAADKLLGIKSLK